MTSCFTLAGCKGDKEVPSTMDTREAQKDAKTKSRNSAKLDPSPTVTQTFFPSDNDSTVTPRKGVKSKSGNRNRFSAPAATRRKEDVREIPQSPILKFSPATTEGDAGENGRSTLPRAKSLTSDRRQREITSGRDITSPRSPEQERPTSQVHRADSVKLLQSPTVEWVLPPALDDNGNPSKKSRSLDNSQRHNHGDSGPDGEAYTPTREAFSFLLPSPTIKQDSHPFETPVAIRTKDRNDNESRSRNPDNSTQGVRSEAQTPNKTEKAENVHRHFEGPETRNRISASSPLKTQEQGLVLPQSPTINRPALLQQDEQMRKIDVTPVKAYQQKSMSLPRKASTPEKNPEHKENVVKMPPSPIVSSPSPKLSYNKQVFPAKSGKDEKVKTQQLLETDIDAVVEPPAEETVDSGNFDDKTKREASNRPTKPNTFPARFSENSERYLEEPVHYRQHKVVASPTKTNTGTAKAKKEWRNSANLETGAVVTSPTAKARITPAKTLEDQPTPEMDTADPTPDSGYFDYRSLESKTIESPTKSEAEGNIGELGNKTDQDKDTDDSDENGGSPFDNKPDAEDVDDEGGEDFEVVEKRATDVYTPDGCVSSEEVVVRRRRKKSGKLQWSLQVNRKSWKTNQGLSKSQSMENLHTAGTDRRLSLQVEPTMKAVSSTSQAPPVFPGDKQTGAPTPNLSQKPKQGPKDPSGEDYSQADTPKQGQGLSGKYNGQSTRSSGDGEDPSTFGSPSQHPNSVASPTTPLLTNDNAQSNKKQPEDPSTFESPSQRSNRVASPTTPSLLTTNAQSNKTQPDPASMTASTSPETTQSDSGKPAARKAIPSLKSTENISSDTKSKSPDNSLSAARSKSPENSSSAVRSKSPENPSAARSKSPENSSSADTRSKSPENSSPADTGSPDSNRVSPTATAIRTPSFFPYKKNPSPSSDIGRSLGTPNRPSSPPKGRQRPTASKTTPPQPSKREPSRSMSNSTEEPDSLPVDSATNGSKRGGNYSQVTAKDDKREAKTSPVNDDPSLTVQKLQSTPVSRLPEGPKVTQQDFISTASGDPIKHGENNSLNNEDKDDSVPEEDGKAPEEILAAEEASSTTVVSYTTRLWRVVLGPFGTARQYFCRLFQGPTRRGSWLILCALILIPIALDYRARRITATQDEV